MVSLTSYQRVLAPYIVEKRGSDEQLNQDRLIKDIFVNQALCSRHSKVK